MIKARVPAQSPQANLRDYKEAYRNFKWSDVKKEFSWHVTGKMNIAHEAVNFCAGSSGAGDLGFPAGETANM
jgi:hypothetical protein